jgi:hypothetical protein
MYAPQQLAVGGSDENFLGIEQPPSLARKIAELMTYIPVVVAAFVSQLGLVAIPKAGGAIQLICGSMVLAIIILTGTRFTLTIWVAIILNLAATLSQMFAQGELPLIGGGLPGMTFWFFNLLGAWYLVQNRSAERRMIIFYLILLVGLTMTGGYYMKTHKVERLGLEGVGGGMANPNTIAYMAGIFSVALMFWSLRCRVALRPILWLLAFVMFVLLLRTVSRTGLALFAVGFMFYLVAVLGGKGMRVSGLIFVGVAVLAASQVTYILADLLQLFEKRLELRTAEGRLGIYQWQTLSDLASTFLFGRGPGDAQMTSTGIQAHNTFVYVHMAWGGITAYPYALWLIFLGSRVYRLAVSREAPIDIKMQVVAYYLMALGGEMTNNINFYAYSSTFAFAVIEKYTVPFSRKKMHERMIQENQAAAWNAPMPALAMRRFQPNR